MHVRLGITVIPSVSGHSDPVGEAQHAEELGFDLVTVWLNDPDGVTNYFAQVGPGSRTATGN